MESLIEWDVSLFGLINGLHSPFWDELMFLISTKWLWIPLYGLILYSLIKKYTPTSIFLVIVATALLIAFSDQTTSSVFKPTFKRYRPCQSEADLPFEVHRVHDKCGGKYGFASSHAANFFALSTFFSLLFKQRNWTFSLFLVAILVSYSRIYLGRHYPADVLAGALIGAVGACLIYALLRPHLNRKAPS